MVSLIVAHDKNLLIGNQGTLPWHLPEDLKFFKKTTMGCPIIMGRKTYESIGRPLPGRLNIVVSSTMKNSELTICTTLEEAIKRAEELQPGTEVFIIGGAGLYKEALFLVNRMYITEVNGEFEGDVYFPDYRNDIGSVWRELDRNKSESCAFVIYERI